ncbi:PAS domain-containing sensor histidine kinase [Chitinophaga polysaccharea]|uniref:PAS domain-containing sensor histidine kinase n=1 Tax=Chitinophaga polysaccharea TaxID=1293035 RepID=UPI0031E6FAD5
MNNTNFETQLNVFSVVAKKIPGLTGIRNLGDGSIVYLNFSGMSILEGMDFHALSLLVEKNKLGYPEIEEDGRHQLAERSWIGPGGQEITGVYEEVMFRYEETDYCLFRILDNFPSKQHLNKELQSFGALFNYASMGIIVSNVQGEIILINDFALHQFGYQRNEVLGKRVEILLPPKFREKHALHRQDYMGHPQDRPMGVGMDLFAVNKNGAEFPVEISLSHYENEDGAFVIAYVNNITERKKAEEKIERLNNELELMVEERTLQLRKSLEQLKGSKEELEIAFGKEKDLGELKSRFVSMASHEFRTPLSIILSSAFLVKQYTTEEDRPKREKYLQRIISSVEMLTDILNDFLSVGRIEEGKVTVNNSTFEVNVLVDDMIQEMQGLLKDGQWVNYRHLGRPEVTLDASLLKHIIMNLFSNAIKFSAENSTVELSTVVEGSQLTLTVKDYGIGMSADAQQHMFERFFRAANAGNIKGTGLGLHIVNKYTELMKGQISCESEIGKGTTFVVVLPINNNAANGEENDPPA